MLGGTRALQQQTGTQMGVQQGFVPGESGKTDAALSQIAQKGQSEYSNDVTQMLNEEAKRKEDLRLRAEDINVRRLLAGARYGGLMNEATLGQGQLGLERNKFGYQKGQDALSMYLNLLANQQGQASQPWQSYWNSILRYGQ